MKPIKTVHDFEILKTIGDARRLDILQLLMDRSYTLSQLGERLELHPAKVRYHLKLLEKVGLVEFVSSREVRGFIEKYYRATAKAYFIHQIILPKKDNEPVVVALGSHDPALDLLAAHFDNIKSTPPMITVPVGSLDGLVALRQRLCHFSGCHLFDPVEKEYNLSFIRHFFPDQKVHILTLAHRQQGLLIKPGNPDAVQGLQDLNRKDITFVNRKKGSGTRLWLDLKLKEMNIDPKNILGYANTVNTHSSVADAILTGRAHVGLGVMAAAKTFGLGFIPLFQERFDLVFLDESYKSVLLRPTLDYLQTAQFRNEIEILGGYESHDTGKMIAI